ncbi:MAG: 30S ribosomal protein S15 [Deltaproteobacteria bacterium]|nr:30S ribosomal protein S15 [Deltaproteobacteria bacterium]
MNHLSEHFKGHQKDHQSRLGLLVLVGRRKRLLSYLRDRNVERYKKVTKELGLRA